MEGVRGLAGGLADGVGTEHMPQTPSVIKMQDPVTLRTITWPETTEYTSTISGNKG